MKKKLLCALLPIMLILMQIPFFSPSAFATGYTDTANKLYELGLFRGIGKNADGSPDFALDRTATRNEAITMLVRLLGHEVIALNGAWKTPFSDVADWVKPYVGYAYTSGLTTGTSATRFSGADAVTASQYLTFVLRALGYSSESDFAWDKAWELSDELGLTSGEYDAATRNFTRGDVAAISFNALTVVTSTGKPLYKDLIDRGAITREAVEKSGLDVIYAKTLPLSLNGREVVSVQYYYKMTMGGVLSECKDGNLIKGLYQFLQNGIGAEVPEPENYGSFFSLDTVDYYYMIRDISFMETAGLGGDAVQKYFVYRLINLGETLISNPDEGPFLIHDSTHDMWYRFFADDFQSEWQKISELGSWVEIFNNVV